MPMSGALVFVFVIVAWLVIGLALSIVMGRRGHAPWSWLVIGTLLGPLAIALAIDARRHPPGRGVPRVLSAGLAAAGVVDVLVGADGSADAHAATVGVCDLFGDRLRRLTLARVISFDGGREEEQQAAADLEAETQRLGSHSVGTVILRGHPSRALAAYADEERYAVVAIGTRGAGRTKALLGSAASELARGCPVPVLSFTAAPVHSVH
jgi:nucleotide-binding universal stress UspA family protein